MEECDCRPGWPPMRGDRWVCPHGAKFKAVAVNQFVGLQPVEEPLIVWYRRSWPRRYLR